jgi:hypothetical protein
MIGVTSTPIVLAQHVYAEPRRAAPQPGSIATIAKLYRRLKSFISNTYKKRGEGVSLPLGS